MSNKNSIEGILLNKIPFKEKNVIGHVLLRNGHKVSVVFYGGQGGGKRHIGSTLQLGYLISFLASGTHKSSFEMLGSNEYKEKWHHEAITTNVKAYYLMCFFNECLEKFSPLATNAHDLSENSNEQVGLFRLLSNAIFRLEKVCHEKSYETGTELGLFLTKAMIELGVFPNSRICEVSGNILKDSDLAYLSAEKGGFVLEQFLEAEDKRLIDRTMSSKIGLHSRLEKISRSQYAEVKNIEFSLNECRELFKFICYQQHMSPSDFKTYTAFI